MATFADTMKEAVAFLQAGEFQEGLAKLDAALEMACDAAGNEEAVAAIQTNRGVALRGMGRLEEALLAFEASIEAKSDGHEALFNRALTLKGLDRLEESLEAFDAALAVQPDFAVGKLGKAEALTALRRTDEGLALLEPLIAAEEEAEAAGEESSTKVGARVQAAVLHCAARQFEEAIAICDKLEAAGKMNQDPRCKQALGIALAESARALSEAGDHQAALGRYDRAMAAQPTVATAFNRAMCHLRAGNEAEAVAATRQILASKPDHQQALRLLGTLLVRAQEFAEAKVTMLRVAQTIAAPGAEADEASQAARELDAELFFNLAACTLNAARTAGDQAAMPAAIAETTDYCKRALCLNGELEAAKSLLEQLGATLPTGEDLREFTWTTLTVPDAPATVRVPTAEPASVAPAAGAGVAAASAGAAPSAPQTAPEPTTQRAAPLKPAEADEAVAPTTTPKKKKKKVTKRLKALKATKPPSPAAGHPASKASAAPAAASAEMADEDGWNGIVADYELLVTGATLPDGVDAKVRERYLSMEEFQEKFNMSKTAFAALPRWKQTAAKKKANLF